MEPRRARTHRRPERILGLELERARAWVLAAQGLLGEAFRTLGEAADTARGFGATTLEAACLHDRARLGDAASVVDRLAALPDDSALSAVRVAHVSAVVDGDAEALAVAGVAFEALGADLLAAEAHADAARRYRVDGHARVAQRQRVRSAELAARCGDARTPALALDEDVSPLTPREREVVTMAAGGLTNRDIAERLVVSVRTVDNLLHRAYVKLGVSSRKEAAAALGLAR